MSRKQKVGPKKTSVSVGVVQHDRTPKQVYIGVEESIDPEPRPKLTKAQQRLAAEVRMRPPRRKELFAALNALSHQICEAHLAAQRIRESYPDLARVQSRMTSVEEHLRDASTGCTQQIFCEA